MNKLVQQPQILKKSFFLLCILYTYMNRDFWAVTCINILSYLGMKVLGVTKLIRYYFTIVLQKYSNIRSK